MNVGIVSPWFERGIAFVSLSMYQALARRHNVFVLAPPGPKPKGDEFDVPQLTRSRGEFKFPLLWALDHELDAVIFNERTDCRQLSKLRGNGFAVLGLLEWEFVPRTDKAAYWLNRCYDAVLAPTAAAHRAFVEMGLENVKRVQWGVDLELFRPPGGREGPARFLQPSNFGGMHGRKNVKATQQAWKRANADAELYVHRQAREPLTHAGMAELYRRYDVALLPSMWEGLGLCFMEAMASGMALVTVDAPPMNEHVVDGVTGFCCRCKMADPPDRIHVQRALINVDDYADRLAFLAAHPEEARGMGAAARARAEKLYDWRVNGEALCEIVEEAVDGAQLDD